MKIKIKEMIKTNYLHLYDTNAEFEEEYRNHYKEPWVSLTREGYSIDYNKEEPPMYEDLSHIR